MIRRFILRLHIVKEELKRERSEGFKEGVACAIEDKTKIFADAQKDILETMRDDLDKQAEELANEKLSKLLTTVDLNQIVKYDKSGKFIFIAGKPADDAQLANLKSEAEMLIGTNLWRIITETPRELAQKFLFEIGESVNDLVKGRSIIYTVSTQDRIVQTFRSYTPKPRQQQ